TLQECACRIDRRPVVLGSPRTEQPRYLMVNSSSGFVVLMVLMVLMVRWGNGWPPPPLARGRWVRPLRWTGCTVAVGWSWPSSTAGHRPRGALSAPAGHLLVRLGGTKHRAVRVAG